MKRGPALVADETRDFLPALLALQNSPPSPLPRAFLYLLLALCAAVAVFCVWGRLDIVAVASGKLVPHTYVKIVQSAEGGRLQDILVKEGDHVGGGQVLLRMDANIFQADTNILSADRARLRLQLQRIDAELAGTTFVPSAGAATAALDAQILAQYQSHRRAFDDARATELAARNKARQELAGAVQIKHKLAALLPTYQQEEAALDKLAAKHLAATLELVERRRKRIEVEQDLQAQTSAIDSARASVEQADKRLAQITSHYHEQLNNERVETQAQFDKAEQELAKQQHRNTLLELKAPQAGIVKDLATHTLGAVVSPGTILMSLVPSDETLQAEVMVRNEDIGFVHVEQGVKLKLAAYPFQKYGTIDGEVTYVGADATDSGNQPVDETHADNSRSPGTGYKVVVALAAQTLTHHRHRYSLTPGMQVTAEFNQGTRTVLNYLLSPVMTTLAEAARER